MFVYIYIYIYIYIYVYVCVLHICLYIYIYAHTYLRYWLHCCAYLVTGCGICLIAWGYMTYCLLRIDSNIAVPHFAVLCWNAAADGAPLQRLQLPDQPAWQPRHLQTHQPLGRPIGNRIPHKLATSKTISGNENVCMYIYMWVWAINCVWR